MNKKVEIYKIILETKIADNKGFFHELKTNGVLKSFLDEYYSSIMFEEKNNNTEDINEKMVVVDESCEVAATEEEIEITTPKHERIKKIDIKSKSICYYIDSIVNEEIEITIDGNERKGKSRNIIMNYIKYDRNIKVVDKDTLTEKFVKKKTDGDLEKQHYIIKSFNEINKGLLLWEKINGAVTIGLIERNLNKEYREYINEQYKDDEKKKKKFLGYHIKIHYVPSTNLLEELASLDKINLLKVCVKKEKITTDEDISFAEDNISRDEVELIYKSKRSLSFSSEKIRKYIKQMNTKKSVKRVIINGKRNGNAITLNTELMKMSEYVNVDVDSDGLINSNNLFIKFEEVLQNGGVLLEDFFIEIDEDEDEDEIEENEIEEKIIER